MTARRTWLVTFADPAALSDLFAAARELMAEGDDCDPELCAHDEQCITPLELAQWIETEVTRAARAPVRLDHRETRSAGQHERRALEMTASG